MAAKRRPPFNAGPLARLGIKAGLLTASDRAERLGCSRSHLLHCEAGAQAPGLSLVSMMMSVYQASEGKVGAAYRACMQGRKERTYRRVSQSPPA